MSFSHTVPVIEQAQDNAPANQPPKLALVPLSDELRACNARLEQELGAEAWAGLTPPEQTAQRVTLLQLLEEADEYDRTPAEMTRRGYTYQELDAFFPREDAPVPPAKPAPKPKPPLFSDLLGAYANVGRERPWFAEGAIEGCPLIMFAGPEKSHKSWTAMDLAVATVLGGKWLGQFQVMRPGPVVYIDGEYGEHEFTRRIARITRSKGEDPRAVLAKIHHIYSANMTLVANDATFRAALEAVTDLQPALIVLDPLRNHLAGNENDAPVVLDAYRCLGKLRDAGKCPVLVLHHLNKSGRFTGSRAITTRADLIIEGSDGDKPVYAASARTIRPKLDPIAKPFTIEAEHDNDGDDTVAATRILYVATDEAGSGKPGETAVPPGLSKMQQELYRFLDKQEEARSVNYIAKSAWAPKARNTVDVKRALDAMTEAGHLEFVKNGAPYKGKHFDGWLIKDAPPTPTSIPTPPDPDVGIDPSPTTTAEAA